MHRAGKVRGFGAKVCEQGVEFLVIEEGEVEGQGILVEGKSSYQQGCVQAQGRFGGESTGIRRDAGR